MKQCLFIQSSIVDVVILVFFKWYSSWHFKFLCLLNRQKQTPGSNIQCLGTPGSFFCPATVYSLSTILLSFSLSRLFLTGLFCSTVQMTPGPIDDIQGPRGLVSYYPSFFQKIKKPLVRRLGESLSIHRTSAGHGFDCFFC